MTQPDKPADFSGVSSSAESTARAPGTPPPHPRADFSGVRATVDTSAERVPAADRGGQSYTVKGGDTLSLLAKHFYGDANAWQAIYDANRDQINDPDLIRPGQVLRIPAASGIRS